MLETTENNDKTSDGNGNNVSHIPNVVGNEVSESVKKTQSGVKEEIITYFGQECKVICDGKCEKAWGISSRPKIILDENDEDNYVWLSDDELGTAPIDPGTYEGDQAKITSPDYFPNKWCVRECERCSKSMPGEAHLPVKLKDFSKRRYNYIQPNEL